MRTGFWSRICEFEWVLTIAFGILAVMLVLSLVSFAVVSPGSESYVLTVFNLLLLLPLTVGCAYGIRRCRKRRSGRYRE